MALSAAGFAAMRERDNRRLLSQFASASESRVRAISRQLDGDLSALTALRGFMEVRQPLTSDDFDRFGARLMEAHPSLMALEWIARVRSPEERRAFELELPHNGAPRPFISDGPPGTGPLSPPRTEYFPVRFLFPHSQANSSAIGYDFGRCGSCRAALAASTLSGQPASMGRLPILEHTRDGYAVPLTLPAYQSASTSRPREPGGYALVMLQIGDVVERALQPFDPLVINIEFSDESAQPANRFLYTHGTRLPSGSPPPTQYTQSLTVGNRTWKLVCTPTPAYIASSRTFTPWLVLLSGMFLTLVAAAQLSSRARIADLRRAEAGARQANLQLEGLVNERTGLLRQSEVRLIDALDAVSDGFWEWSIPTGEVYYSPQWIRILGYSPADVPARVEFFFGIVHPDDVGRAQTAIDDHLAGRTQLKHLDIRLRRKSGEYLLVSDRGRIVAWDQHGTPVRMVGSITDVSSQRRAEDKLREDVLLADFSAAIGTCLTSGENLRAALQGCCEAMTAILGAASARIWTLDPAQGFLNLQALSGDPGTLETGRSRVPLGSLGIGMIAQSSQPHIAASIENDIWIGESEWAAKEGMITFAGYPLLVEGRTVGVAELYGRRLFTPAAFQTLNTATNVIAISIHRDQARRQLRESDEKIHHVLAGALDAIVTMDAQGRITGWNPRAESIFGWSAAEAIDRRLADLIIPPAAREGHGRGLRRFLQTGQTHMLNRVLELTAIRRDGSEFPVELVVASFTSQGEQHFSSFIRDITDRKQLESQVLRARKMDGLGQLAGGIAHDFNDLLIVINGAAQRGEINLAQGRSTRDDLAAIRTAASQASSLTQRILAFSRNQTLQPATVDFNRLIHQVAAMLQRLIGEQIEVSLDLDPELCRVTIDSAQFEQVIVNLAINSRDAMPEGGRLTLQTRNLLLAENDLKLYPSLQPGHHAQLSVVDTGLGMDEATRQSVFEPFFTTKPPGQGTGLGLSMAYGVVCQSDGDIRVSSTPGSGTTVTILLPRAFGEPLQFPIAPQPALRRGAETILVVEDDAAVRTLAARFLTAAGYCVHTAAHGPEALHLLKGLSGAVDLVLTDLAMPEMDGHTLATHIRTSHPGVRLIFTSGYLREDLEPEVAFLQKPYDLLDLAAKIRKTLDA